MPLKLHKLNLKLLFYPISAGLLLGLGFWTWWSWASAPIQPTRASTLDQQQQLARGKTVQIRVPQGSSAKQIGQTLQQVGLIRSAPAWSLWTRWLLLQDSENSLKAGVYQLSPTQSLQGIAETIQTGDVVQTSFTIPEGKSLKQMADYFEAQGFFSAQDFLRAASQPYKRYPWLPPGLPHLEGFLYPDTYQLPTEQITPEAVVQIMLDRFQQVALPLYQNPQRQLSLLEWVTLASIVEKEAVVPAERPRIAGVFQNRLRQKIPLGADPTVEYSLGIQQTPDQPLTLAQVNTPSAYNTYLKSGLPPTPIASPGLASFKAALTPEKTNYFYFVARHNGTHIFSKTLSEHEAAQARIRNQRAMSSPKN